MTRNSYITIARDCTCDLRVRSRSHKGDDEARENVQSCLREFARETRAITIRDEAKEREREIAFATNFPLDRRVAREVTGSWSLPVTMTTDNDDNDAVTGSHDAAVGSREHICQPRGAYRRV